MESGCLPDVGTRFSLGSHRGTIRWIGEIKGAKGSWLGVEWDDANRGKHNGEHEGITYFTCRVPDSGSFLRYNSKLAFGSSFLQALKARYVGDIAPISNFQDKDVTKQYTRKNLADIEVETPNMDLIIQKTSQLHKLRAIGLSGTQNEEEQDLLVARAFDVSLGEQEGNIISACPNVRSLNLSRSLLPSWLELSKITIELPNLDSIELHFNRFSPPSSGMMPLPNAFKKLRELRMDGSLMSWDNVLSLSSELPALEVLQLSSNNIKKLNGAHTTRRLSKLKSLNLEGNLLHDWEDLHSSLAACPSLERLVLSSNALQRMQCLDRDHVKFRHVSLWDNPILSWQDIENMNAAFGGLESVNLGGNACPLARSSSPSEMRLIAIARLSNLQVWNNTTVSNEERREAELYYLSVVSKENLASCERNEQHPRYAELVRSHGAPVSANDSIEAKTNGTLRSKLLTISVHLCDHPPSSTPPYLVATKESKSISLLTTTPLRLLLGKLARSFKINRGSKSIFAVWALLGQSIDSSQIIIQQIRSELKSDDDIDSAERIVFQMDNLERDLRGYNFSQEDEIILVVKE